MNPASYTPPLLPFGAASAQDWRQLDLGIGAAPLTVALRVAATRMSAQVTLGESLALRVQELNGIRFRYL